MGQLLMLFGILVGSYGVITALSAWLGWNLSAGLRGRISLALLFLFTGTSHFYLTEEMVQMLPPSIPGRVELVYLTGVLEIAGAVGLLIPALSRLAAISLILFLFAVLPANIYAALNNVGMGAHGAGPVYLLARVPFQLLLVGWAYYFGVRRAQKGAVNWPRPVQAEPQS